MYTSTYYISSTCTQSSMYQILVYQVLKLMVLTFNTSFVYFPKYLTFGSSTLHFQISNIQVPQVLTHIQEASVMSGQSSVYCLPAPNLHTRLLYHLLFKLT